MIDYCKHYWAPIVIAIGLLLIAAPYKAWSATQTRQVAVIASAESAIYRQTFQGIQNNIGDNVSLYYTDIQKLAQTPDAQNPLQDTHYIICIGQSATEFAIAHYPSARLVAILVTKPYLQETIAEHTNKNIIGITIDQPLARRIKAIKSFLPNVNKIGIASSKPVSADAQQLIKNLGLTLNAETINDEKNLIKTIGQLSNNSDAILALPDPDIYNRHTIRHILLKTYRLKTPLIGFSKALNKAGALLSVYTPPELVGKQVAELLQTLKQDNKQLKQIYKPKYFQIIINEQVAKSLAITLPDDIDYATVRQD